MQMRKIPAGFFLLAGRILFFVTVVFRDRQLPRFFGYDRAVPRGIIDYQGHREPAFFDRSDPIKNGSGLLFLIFLTAGKHAPDNTCNPFKHALDIGDEPFACRARVDPDPELRERYHPPHASDDTHDHVIRVLYREFKAPRFMFAKYLGIDITVTACAATCRNDEDIRKIRNIVSLIKIFNFSIADRTRAAEARPH
jgi:hypothetical protein